MDESITPEEAAKRLKMHPVTVRRLLREGQLSSVKVGKRQWRVSTAALEQFLQGDQKPAVTKDE